MQEYVLFSPVGGHDPISNYSDGAMLHICRVYRPKKVYLYMSKEMIERHDKDNRYVDSLERLQKFLDYKIEEIKVIQKENLVEVQLFDVFYKDFESIIGNIIKENETSELLLNISSGTPAMKSALNIIATLAEHKMTAIQVTTPKKKENFKQDKPEDYDNSTYWDLNNDNKEDFKIRCSPTNSVNLMAKIKKEMILRLMEAYDYNAALTIAEDIKEFINEDCLKLLKAASFRLMLNQSGISKMLIGTDIDITPIKTGGKKEIFEYLLFLQIRQKQGAYSDFIRGITPVILDLFENCLVEQCHINIKDYCTKSTRDGHDIYYLSSSKFEETEKGKDIKKLILDEIRQTEIKSVVYSSAHIFPIIRGYLKNEGRNVKLIEDLEKLRRVETEVRNFAAHEIISVTDEWIEKRVSMTSAEILKVLKNVAINSGLNIKNEYWNSYDDMNVSIKNFLKA